jgi:glucosamine kinase
VVIAVDAGGSNTRVGCFSLDGDLLAQRTGTGGSLTHNDDAAEAVGTTLQEAIAEAGVDVGQVRALVAGSAGVSIAGPVPAGYVTDEEIAALYELPGSDGPRLVVNDAVVAHRGALAGRPGVIVVAGTGSMILAITADGDPVESGAFQHYAGAARHLAFEAVQRLLTTGADAEDPLVPLVLAHFAATDLEDLRRVVVRGSFQDHNDLKRHYGTLAPAVTGLADASALADAALRDLAERTARGALLVAPMVGDGPVGADPVPVALAGSLAETPEFQQRLAAALDGVGAVPVQLERAELSPLGGAALMALELADALITDEVRDRIALACTPGESS